MRELLYNAAMKRVILQLDYYLGGQFAGLASGLARGMFAARGLDLSLVAPCTPGNEGAAVVAHQRQTTTPLTWTTS